MKTRHGKIARLPKEIRGQLEIVAPEGRKRIAPGKAAEQPQPGAMVPKNYFSSSAPAKGG
jgi:hypothetical protein